MKELKGFFSRNKHYNLTQIMLNGELFSYGPEGLNTSYTWSVQIPVSKKTSNISAYGSLPSPYRELDNRVVLQ